MKITELNETEITDLDLLNASIIYLEGDTDNGKHFFKQRFFTFGGSNIWNFNSSRLGAKLAIHFKDLRRMVTKNFPEDKNFLKVVKNMYENEAIWQQNGDNAYRLRSTLLGKHSE